MSKLGLEEEKEETRNIPPEIMKAVESGEGFSLLIKGAPGTGKTSLALEILKKTKRPGIYLSTRVSPESLYKHFPWLERCIEPINIIDTGQVYVSSDLKVYTTAVTGVVSFPERLAKRIEELEENVTLVVDSWDAITEQIDPEKMRALEALITELVREKNVNLILTSETLQTTHLDYMVDGVALVNDVRVEGRRAREVEISKLRMMKLEQTKYPFTLDGGRFNCFLPFQMKATPASPAKIPPILHTETSLSTGSKELDELLGGGYKKGSFNIIEISDDITAWGYENLVGFSILNHIAQKKNFILIPPCGRGEEHLKIRILPFLNEEDYKTYVKVFEMASDEYEATEMDNVIPLKTESLEEDLKIIRSYIGKLKPPVLSVIAADALEYPYRLVETGQLGNAIKEITKNIKNTKTMGNVDIVRVTKDLKIAPELIDMASTYFKIVALDKTVVLFGVKPETELYNIESVFYDGCPQLKLTPYV